MKTLIISDIHNNVAKLEAHIDAWYSEYKFDELVFLGDYFDSFGDNPKVAAQTAEWLAHSVQQDNRIHLLGNHDMPYMLPYNNSLWCPGFSAPKLREIQKFISADLWALFRPAVYVQNWLLSHAGFARDVVEHPVLGVASAEGLVNSAETALNIVKTGISSPYFNPGSRLGEPYTGGITWCDWNDEFVPIDGINQILGHTPSPFVRCISGPSSTNYCMDTFNKHLCLITDGSIEFISAIKLRG